MLNSVKLKKMNPVKIISKVKDCDLYAEKVLDEMSLLIYPEKYENLPPRKQVWVNGMFFHNLFYMCLDNLNIDFKDKNLQTRAEYTENRPIISNKAYKKLPKQYRGLFMEYDSSNDVLHDHNAPYTILSGSKKDKVKLKSLLTQAKALIPLIYDEQEIQNNTTNTHFVKDSVVNTIMKLHEIFIEIANITKSYQRYDICFETKPGEYTYRPGAGNLYNEYRNELTLKNRYLTMQKKINKAKAETTGLKTLLEHSDKTDNNGIKVLLAYAEQNYRRAHDQIIANAKNRTRC